MAINVLVVDLIPANPIELNGYRAQANTNRSDAERSIIELNGVECLITKRSRFFTLNKMFDFVRLLNTKNTNYRLTELDFVRLDMPKLMSYFPFTLLYFTLFYFT